MNKNPEDLLKQMSPTVYSKNVNIGVGTVGTSIVRLITGGQTDQITNFLELSCSLRANGSSASQEIPRIL